eukprot:1184302-Pleurochrysis_carterae.AAC.1
MLFRVLGWRRAVITTYRGSLKAAACEKLGTAAAPHAPRMKMHPRVALHHALGRHAARARAALRRAPSRRRCLNAS